MACTGLALCAVPQIAVAQMFVNPATGHTYQRVVATKTWDQASIAAANQMLGGTHGHLATITSSGEHGFITSSFGINALRGCWLGGFQQTGSPEPGGGWAWVTGEPWAYNFGWAPNEPNNASGYGGGTHEDGLQFKASNHYGSWNDFWRGSTDPGWVVGYLVEWDVPAAALQLTVNMAPKFASMPSVGWNRHKNYSRIAIQNATTAEIVDVGISFSDALTGQEIAVARYAVGGPSPVPMISSSEFNVPIAVLPASYYWSLPTAGAAPSSDRLRVTVQVSTATRYGQVDLPPLHALWRMPTGIPRFGDPDIAVGYDDWCRKGTYDWMVTQSVLLATTAVNDVSKEHGGPFPPHVTHQRGSDIDIAHFTNLTGNSPIVGAANYQQLRRLVSRAVRGSAVAKAVVMNWLAAERAGLEPLLADPMVAEVRTGTGSGTTLLRPGWLKQLLVRGTVTTVSGTYFSFGTHWMPIGWRKRAFDPGHNDHSHIDLDDSQL